MKYKLQYTKVCSITDDSLSDAKSVTLTLYYDIINSIIIVNYINLYYIT